MFEPLNVARTNIVLGKQTEDVSYLRKAEECLGLLIERKADSYYIAEISKELAYAYNKLGFSQFAANCLSSVIDQYGDKKFSWVVNRVADSFCDQGNIKEADFWNKRAQALNPNRLSYRKTAEKIAERASASSLSCP